MTWFKIKLRKSDQLFSQYVRKRDKMFCQYNFRCFKGTIGNQTSQFQKRRHQSVRRDPQNGDWSCGKCHYFIENDPEGQKILEEFKKKQLGMKAYNLLMIRKEAYQRKDERLAILYCEKLLLEL